MKLIDLDTRNKVLASMMKILDEKREEIIQENKKDLEAFNRDDQALYDRLVCDDAKIDGMIQAIKEVKSQDDPVGKVLDERTLDNGLQIVNRKAPFGTIMIIYESRPDVTIEAAVLAFKANNKILLKGGKEAIHSNKVLVNCWHEALAENGLEKEWITMLQLKREETQGFLKNPPEPVDLIVPRGSERLIEFVKKNASCAVLASGRGNNFLYVAPDANWKKSLEVIINAKTDKTSGCNSLENVLLDKNLPDYENKVKELVKVLKDVNVEVLAEEGIHKISSDAKAMPSEDTYWEEFLDMRILLAEIDGIDNAIDMINKMSGGHSITIMTETKTDADKFMEQIDAAAVYHNASTRFTDGGQMGVGAELAISTDKLHHRGPLGLKQLATNKYYVFGDGQIRE